ncbi:PilZ domain-containing protein [Noviherbaspirillum sp. ST9]|uniref:PilZ domain-containing protein n=1 Tax=Noviherbaspirillum sp. ST9 TaxID=3401606 RepID=UPI003B585C64
MNNYGTADARRFVRTTFHVDAKLLLAPAIVAPCEILDIAEGGIGLAFSSPLPSDTRCMISFDSPYGGKPVRLNAWARVIYSCPCGHLFRTGVQLLDMDSYSRLLIQEIQSQSSMLGVGP